MFSKFVYAKMIYKNKINYYSKYLKKDDDDF
jgi:hypothetical protein